MAHSVQDHRNSLANQLRNSLDEAEKAVLRLKAEEVEPFLLGLDELDCQFQTLESDGLDLRGERTRQGSLVSRMNRHPKLITAPASPMGGLAALRQKHPTATDEWWFLDVVEAERRGKLIRRIVTNLGVLAGVILLIYVGLTYIFPPDPNAVLSSNASGRLPELAAAGEWEEADKLIAETLAQMTADDPELLIWQSVVAGHFGRQEEADTAFAKAQASVPAEKLSGFWSTVGNVRMAAGDVAGAFAAAQEALAIDPNEAQAYFVLASLAEADGNVPEAIGYFEKAFELATDSNPQLAVIARVRMGMLMQSGPPMVPMTTTNTSGP